MDQPQTEVAEVQRNTANADQDSPSHPWPKHIGLEKQGPARNSGQPASHEKISKNKLTHSIDYDYMQDDCSNNGTKVSWGDEGNDEQRG